MKKYLYICLLATLGIVITACNNNAPQLSKKTIDLVVNSNQWEFDQDVNQYYCHFNVPELTETAYNYGEVSVSREYNSGTAKAYQVALPETSYKVEYEVNEATGDTTNTFYYAQHIDYGFGIGFVEVFYTISDYFYPEGETPGNMLFRLQLTY